MRRAEREVEEPEQIAEMLRRLPILRLALNATPAPYVVPVNFGFEQNGATFAIYFHSAKEGRKVALLKSNANVGFEADRLIETVLAEPPCRSTAFFESVVGRGKAVFLETRAEKKAGMDAVMRRAGFVDKLEYSDAALDAVALVKIVVEEIVGKRHLPE